MSRACVSSIMGERREPSYGFNTEEQTNKKECSGKMSRGLFYLQIKVLSGFLHFMESKCWFGQCQKVLNSPFENESRPSSPGKRASRNLTRSGLLSTPLRWSPQATMGGMIGLGGAWPPRERWRKETGTRRRGKNRHWQKTDMTAWQTNKETYLINTFYEHCNSIHWRKLWITRLFLMLTQALFCQMK